MIIDLKKKRNQKQEEHKEKLKDVKKKAENYDEEYLDKLNHLLEKIIKRSKKFIVSFMAYKRRR